MTRLLSPLTLAILALMLGCRPGEVITTADPGAAVTPQAPATADALPAGTTLDVRLAQPIGTDISRVGDTFTAEVVSPITARDGATAVPAGAEVRGRVTGVAPSERVGDPAVIRVDFDELVINGRTYGIDAEVVDTDVRTADRRVVGDETAIGAVAGAALGLIVEGDLLSMLIGGALGAGAGTAIALGTGDVDAVLPSGAGMTIQTTGRVPLR